jgi:calcineurin-like phosphoesterase family protein
MSRVWLYADPHFSHQGVCEFLRGDGTKLRPWDTYQEMDKELIYRYINTVKRDDKVYFLGDVAMKDKHLDVLHSLPGDKVLIKGNHDTAKLSVYQRYFRDVRAYWVLAGCVLSHVPIHPQSLSRWRANIHGHLHANEVTRDMQPWSDDFNPDPRYLCVSVEHTDFAPILLEDAIARINSRQGGSEALASET